MVQPRLRANYLALNSLQRPRLIPVSIRFVICYACHERPCRSLDWFFPVRILYRIKVFLWIEISRLRHCYAHIRTWIDPVVRQFPYYTLALDSWTRINKGFFIRTWRCFWFRTHSVIRQLLPRAVTCANITCPSIRYSQLWRVDDLTLLFHTLIELSIWLEFFHHRL